MFKQSTAHGIIPLRVTNIRLKTTQQMFFHQIICNLTAEYKLLTRSVSQAVRRKVVRPKKLLQPPNQSLINNGSSLSYCLDNFSPSASETYMKVFDPHLLSKYHKQSYLSGGQSKSRVFNLASKTKSLINVHVIIHSTA